MLSDRDALLRAIRTNPEEDTPRLMYADWLDEQGDAASLVRAEFIRLQCELARLEDDASASHPVYEFLRDRDFVTRPSADWTKIDDGIHRRIALTMRAADLLKQHGASWVPALPESCKVSWGGFHRGFPHRVEFESFRNLGKIAARLRAAAPSVTLVTHTLLPKNVEQLAKAGLLSWISGLELSSDSGAGLRAFGHHAEAAGVRRLRVGFSASTETTSALADAPHWIGLHELDLTGTTVYADAAEELFRAKHVRSLKRLHIHGYNWPTETFRVFAAGEFANLTSLRFSGCGLNDDAAEVVAACPALAKLCKLDLDHNNLQGRGATALLCSPHLANVSFLGLESNPCTGLDGKRLAAAPPAGLRMLHAHGCRFTTADVRKLARCPRLSTLWYLDLDANGLRTAAVRELIQGFGKWCPPIIWMTHNRIDDRGAAMLANWKAAKALRILHLKFNDGMTDAGARALLDSPNLTGLDGLGVSTESEVLESRLKLRFRHNHITYY